MRRFLRADYLLPLILLAGMSQYAMVAVGVMVSGGDSLWQLESDALNSAGMLRYVKDVLVIFLSCAWLIVLPKLVLPPALIYRIRLYFIWIFLVVFIGSLGFVFGFSPPAFFPAGMRWILLLHASLGVFILTSTLVTSVHRHMFIFKFLWVFLLVDTYAVMLQFASSSSLFGLAFGAARLTGLFSNAGVAAFFAIAIALVSFQLEGVQLKKRITTTLLCMFLALSSGTRFATVAIFILLLIQMFEMAEMGDVKLRGRIKLMFVPLAFIGIFLGYQALNQQVDRGDAISQQFEKGGRIGNLLEFVDMLGSADFDEVLVGRGLGIGTNTAIAANMAEGIDPGIYRFNLLTDNAFITGIFQFGILGSLLFWFGIFKFIAFVKPKYSKTAKQRYLGIVFIILLTLVAGSPFEHYFLMMSYSISLGAVYWSDRVAYQKLRQA